MHEFNVLVFECRLVCCSSSDVYMYYVVGLFECMSAMCLPMNVGYYAVVALMYICTMW